MSKEEPQNELISMIRIVGTLIDGFGTKLIVAGFAVWIAYEVFSRLHDVVAPITTAMGGK